MAFKFRDHDTFMKTVNQWVRDGSNITDFSTGEYMTTVDLLGRDGCKEELALFHDDGEIENDLHYHWWPGEEEKVVG